MDNKNLGNWNTLGNWNKLGDDNTLGDGNTLGNWNELSDDNTLGNGNTLGDGNTLGNWNTLGNCNTLGDGFKFGKRLKIEGVRVLALMNMSNVDGSGRKILIVIHTHGIIVRAGCFVGSLDEFCEKALSEGKRRYARVVKAAAEALAEDVKESGITGGWDERN